MPGIIGYNVIGVTGTAIFTPAVDNNYAHKSAPLRYTAVAGDILQQIHIYGDSLDAPDATMTMGLYTFVGALPSALINTTPIVLINGVAAWYSSAILNWPLVAGTVYVLAFSPTLRRPRINYDGGVINGSYNAIGALPNPWVEAFATGNIFSFYGDVVFGGAAPPSGGMSAKLIATGLL
ncbi:MAG: hypothetical protein PHC43_00240 [Candidatus Marinimicrobia bacterium]|jgi:hypothetical protein|nr:hypothetical protein [Candidatus Neomarinimicrobiota bacterium]